jgi:hypothetical protein
LTSSHNRMNNNLYNFISNTLFLTPL